jgi:hypothetical protein
MPVQVDEAAAVYLRHHRAEERFSAMCDLVRECFPDLVGLRATLQDDWDEPGLQYVVLATTLPAGYPTDRLLEQEKQVYQRQVERLPHDPEMLIRHSFDRAGE